MQLTVKVYIGDEIRRLTLQDNCYYALLRTTLSNVCNLSRDFLIKYKDEEGDMISITSDIEFQAAKTLATEPILRLWIFGYRKERMENVASLTEQFISSPVYQQFAPYAQAAHQVAQQAAHQLFPSDNAGQQAAQQAAQQFIPLAQQAGQQLLPYAQAAQQVAQEHIIPLAQQAAQQLIPLAQQAAQQLIPAAQEAAKQVQQACSMQPVKVPVSTSPKPVPKSTPVPESTPVPKSAPVSESTPASTQVNSDVDSDLRAYYQRWEEKLNLLKDMGFCQEEDHLVHLLEQYEGQTERVIEALF